MINNSLTKDLYVGNGENNKERNSPFEPIKQR